MSNSGFFGNLTGALSNATKAVTNVLPGSGNKKNNVTVVAEATKNGNVNVLATNVSSSPQAGGRRRRNRKNTRRNNMMRRNTRRNNMMRRNTRRNRKNTRRN